MCKYKPSLTKTETSYMFALLKGSNCRFVDYKKQKMWTLYFYSCPAIDNSLSVSQRFMIFKYEK